MERGGEILDLTAGDVMSRHPVSVARATLAAEALNIMEQRKITSIVVAEDGLPTRVAGVLHLHDLWRMEMFGDWGLKRGWNSAVPGNEHPGRCSWS